MTLQNSQGIVNSINSPERRTDYLYRLSLKAIIRNDKGEILVVKEIDRDWWDLPGGGMDHNEDIKSALARELNEEINLVGNFTYRVIAVDSPKYLETHDFWQVRLIFEIKPEIMKFSPGPEGDEVKFVDPSIFENSDIVTEQWIFKQYQQLNSPML